MSLAEQLKEKQGLKVIEFADKFIEKVKPMLFEAAEEGHGSVMYIIDINVQEERDRLQLYSDPLFVEHLNKNLDGVKVRYEKQFIEHLLFNSLGRFRYSLHFSWSE